MPLHINKASEVQVIAAHFGVTIAEAKILLRAYRSDELLSGQVLATDSYAGAAPPVATKSVVGTTAGELSSALGIMEDSIPVGAQLQVELCTASMPTAEDLANLYINMTAKGMNPSYPVAQMVSGVPTTTFTVQKLAPAAPTGGPVTTGQFGEMIAILPTIFIVGLIAFGITQIGSISSAVLPILITVVVGAVAVAVVIAVAVNKAPKQLVEAGAQRLLPRTLGRRDYFMRECLENHSMKECAAMYDKEYGIIPGEYEHKREEDMERREKSMYLPSTVPVESQTEEYTEWQPKAGVRVKMRPGIGNLAGIAGMEGTITKKYTLGGLDNEWEVEFDNGRREVLTPSDFEVLHPLSEMEPQTEQGQHNLTKEQATDVREVLFTIYDSMSALAGGTETPLESELSLLESKVSKLVTEGVFPPSISDKIIPGYLAAARAHDGQQAHFYSRMVFNQAVNLLMKSAQACASDVQLSTVLYDTWPEFKEAYHGGTRWPATRETIAGDVPGMLELLRRSPGRDKTETKLRHLYGDAAFAVAQGNGFIGGVGTEAPAKRVMHITEKGIGYLDSVAAGKKYVMFVSGANAGSIVEVSSWKREEEDLKKRNIAPPAVRYLPETEEESKEFWPHVHNWMPDADTEPKMDIDLAQRLQGELAKGFGRKTLPDPMGFGASRVETIPPYTFAYFPNEARALEFQEEMLRVGKDARESPEAGGEYSVRWGSPGYSPENIPQGIPPVPAGLNKTVVEERAASDTYEGRMAEAEKEGDHKTVGVYKYLIKDEHEHENMAMDRLLALGGGTMKYVADTAEYMAQTINDTGWRERLDKEFQAAMKRTSP